MIAFTPCKINLGLHILARRPDGYHDIETGFYPVPWHDVLEIVPARTQHFSSTGISLSCPPESNLCMQAFNLLRDDFDLPPTAIHLHKIIPIGSGLGGGSSNAAYTLMLSNRLFDLNLPFRKLHSYAGLLGSDCAFFLQKNAMLGSGIGNVLAPLPLSLCGKYVTLVFPGLSIASAEAYGRVKPRVPDVPLPKILAGDMALWKTTLVNDFESTVFEKHPSIAAIKAELYRCGALYASLSGSGSVVFGIFDKPVSLHRFFPSMLSRVLPL